jgi:hypothetical protein
VGRKEEDIARDLVFNPSYFSAINIGSYADKIRDEWEACIPDRLSKRWVRHQMRLSPLCQTRIFTEVTNSTIAGSSWRALLPFVGT